MTTLSILGGRVVDPAHQIDTITDLHIADGKILAIGAPPPHFVAQKQIQADNLVVCPGLIDLSVRLREQGTQFSETRAAAYNGITTVCCPPDINPIIDNPAVVDLLKHRADKTDMAKVLPIAALTQGLAGECLAEMGTLKEFGCIAVSNALQAVKDTQVLRYALEYANNLGLPVFIHAQDAWLGRNGYIHEGEISTRLGLTGIPATAETIAIATYLLLIELTGVKAHFCHLSVGRSVQMIQEAQANGLPVSADVSSHHLFLTELDIGDYDTQCHVIPPFRTQRDRNHLRAGLLEGTINAICSDHYPHELDAKRNPFSLTAAGLSGLDSFLPLTLKMAEEHDIDLLTALSWITAKPAQILGIPAGTLGIGAVADVCIFDPNAYWILTPENMHSSKHNTPLLGWELKGRVRYTVIDGRVVYPAKSLS